MVADSFKYYALTDYQENQSRNIILKSYKSSNNTSNGITTFICYDIISESYITYSNSNPLNEQILIEPPSNNKQVIFERNLIYKGKLKFTINEILHELCIEELPTIRHNFDEFQVFTSDILDILKRCIKEYNSIVELRITIRPQVFAFSPEVAELIKGTYSYQVSKSIFERTKKIKEALIKRVESEKKKQREKDANIERELERRRKTFGLVKEDYKTEEEYLLAVNQKVRDYALKKREHCIRQYNINMDYCISSIIDLYKEESTLSSILEAFGIVESEKEELIYQKYDNEIDPEKKKITEKVLNGYLIKLKIELEKIIIKSFPIIREIKDEFDSYYKSDLKLFDRTGYDEKGLAKELSRDYCYYLAERLKEAGIKLTNCLPDYPSTEKQAAIEKMMNHLLICQRLCEKISYYTHIIDNPESFIEFGKDNKLTSVLMECPVFFKFGYDYFPHSSEVINLLMIKPGTNNFNLENLKCFANPENKENFGRYKADSDRLDLLRCVPRKKLEYHTKYIEDFIKNKHYTCERLIITVPNSLPLEKVRELILFGFKYAKSRINFVCEGIENALYIKKYIITRELNNYKNGESFIGDLLSIFVNIDPNYYQNYCLTFPSNKSFFMQYAFKSKYKYRRKKVLDIKGEISAAIWYNMKKNNGNINYREVEENLLGTYNELEYNPYNFSKEVSEFLQQAYEEDPINNIYYLYNIADFDNLPIEMIISDESPKLVWRKKGE